MVSTRTVADLLGMRVGTLAKAAWDGRIPDVPRGPGDCRCWRRVDVELACRVLLGRALRPAEDARLRELLGEAGDRP